MVVATVMLVLVGGGGATVALTHPWSGQDAPTVPPSSTAVVERTSLSAKLVLSAQLEYSTPTTLVGVEGMLTRLPHPGDIVTTGQALYEVDGHAVLSFLGERPLWRAVEAGVRDGPDVQEVEQNLVALGFGENLTVDNTFTAVTERAIQAWQKSLGRERTGVIAPGDVVMVAAASVRVNTVTGLVGGSAAGAVLSYTDPGIHGRIGLSADQLSQLAPGMPVSVRLPGGTETPATIGVIDPGGAPTADPAKPTAPSARVDFADGSVVQGIGLPALRVTVGVGGAENALVVPVTALVALADGGYAVEVDVVGGPPRTVPVQVGLVADSRAQITAGDVSENDRVVVVG
ncbi:hypothetical protein C5B96_12060 [Subtercola sp. Z020]|nr:hypothetical protein C5B96_12060 [Subtercola sp. Z020]